jgi:hypothetical protein
MFDEGSIAAGNDEASVGNVGEAANAKSAEVPELVLQV